MRREFNLNTRVIITYYFICPRSSKVASGFYEILPITWDLKEHTGEL